MHNDNTAKQIPHAMPALTRRVVLCGAAASISPPAVAFAADQSADSPLTWLIDEHSEVKDAYNKIQDEMDALSARADMPARPEVSLLEIGSSFYSPVWMRRVFHSLAEIDEFFETFPDMQWWIGNDWAERHSDYHQAARLLFAVREAEYSQWREMTGYRALADRSEEIVLDLLDPLEDRIASYPCESFAEVVAKARWVEQEYGDEISQERALLILRSMAGISPSQPDEVANQRILV